MPSKQYTHLKWHNHCPVSTIFDDIYFSADDGLAETDHVFLQGNDLPERWADFGGEFTIIETGFGTGLNFFASVDLWKKCAKSGAKLNYISIEKYPLQIDDIKKAIGNWSEFNEFLNDFAVGYNPDL